MGGAWAWVGGILVRPAVCALGGRAGARSGSGEVRISELQPASGMASVKARVHEDGHRGPALAAGRVEAPGHLPLPSGGMLKSPPPHLPRGWHRPPGPVPHHPGSLLLALL